MESKRVVSFDMDGTLTAEDSTNEFEGDSVRVGINPKIYRLFKKHQAQGHKVIVVTARKGSPEMREDVKRFLQHFRLKPDGVFFTDGDWKVNTLLELEVDIHYDNDSGEIAMIKKYGMDQVKGILVGNYL